MHQTDEHVEIAHIHQLKAIYARILADYFAADLSGRLLLDPLAVGAEEVQPLLRQADRDRARRGQVRAIVRQHEEGLALNRQVQDDPVPGRLDELDRRASSRPRPTARRARGGCRG